MALPELVINCVEAENQCVVVNRSEVRNIRVRIKLTAFKKVIRNLNLAAEKGQTLFRNKMTAAGKLFFKLQGRDVAKRIVILEVLMKVVSLAANDKNIPTLAT